MELLGTPELTLREWEESDVDAFFDIYSRWEVARRLGAQPRRALATLDEARDKLGAWRGHHAGVAAPLGLWAVVPAGASAPVGTVLLLPLEADPIEYEIGWHLHPDAQGRGLATKAAGALLAAARDARIPRLLALTDLDNDASAAVAGRLGMRDEGVTDRWFGLTLRRFGVELRSDPT